MFVLLHSTLHLSHPMIENLTQNHFGFIFLDWGHLSDGKKAPIASTLRNTTVFDHSGMTTEEQETKNM